ncbi:hypothetical protein J8L84_19660 [Alteromonas sp. MMG017]|uniref:hypothetical protein n=1 Tax=Alteromonas sp. MMG017 TaxID=2822692 RepID=UPI001B3A21CF|nr:hypothetical protein [Alteromonas sp. MMG017]MBQ4831502.1 hypothetical protein [Alteromonas sp. MMG017]
MASPKFHMAVRKYHRWLGFFLAGIMAIYAVSGVLLIFRPTDFLKFDQTEVRQLSQDLNGKQVASKIKVKGLKVVEENDNQVVLNMGTYDKVDGVATITRKDYPLVLAKMVKLHKATNNSPLFWLNISFGVALLFFVISAFLMFMPKLPMYKNGLKIAGLGAVVAVLVVMFGS